MNLNILYCFDSNYDKQAQCSIYSLLQNVSEEINITIIHKNHSDVKFLHKKILNHPNLKELKVCKFINKNKRFPNLQGAHISEATYYRLYLEEYIDSEIDYLLYIDADIICFADPIIEIQKQIKKLVKSKFILSAKTETTLTDGIDRIGLSTKRYFNAGVLLINYQLWMNNKSTEGLTDLLFSNIPKLDFWDQDLLNIYFDDAFDEMNQFLNYQITMDKNKRIKVLEQSNLVSSEKILIHYSGKFKPWNVKGILDKRSSYYQNIYKELFSDKYHLSYNYKKNALVDLLNGFKNKRILDLEYPFTFIYLVIKSLFK
jgi:lipopolysaccharide biosynthesis glycosyltransferase